MTSVTTTTFRSDFCCYFGQMSYPVLGLRLCFSLTLALSWWSCRRILIRTIVNLETWKVNNSIILRKQLVRLNVSRNNTIFIFRGIVCVLTNIDSGKNRCKQPDMCSQSWRGRRNGVGPRVMTTRVSHFRLRAKGQDPVSPSFLPGRSDLVGKFRSQRIVTNWILPPYVLLLRQPFLYF